MITRLFRVSIRPMDSNLLLKIMMTTPLCEIAEWDRILKGKSQYTFLNEDEQKIRNAIDAIIHLATYPSKLQIEKKPSQLIH